MPNPAKHGVSITYPDGKVRNFLLNASKITVGRGKDNDIAIPCSTVSTRHCEFRRKGTTGSNFEIVDLGSTNGTHLNNEEIGSADARELRNDDNFTIGLDISARFFQMEEIAEKALKPGKTESPSVAALSGAVTERLRDIQNDLPPKREVTPRINPVAAAVAKAENGE